MSARSISELLHKLKFLYIFNSSKVVCFGAIDCECTLLDNQNKGMKAANCSLSLNLDSDNVFICSFFQMTAIIFYIVKNLSLSIN